MRQIKDAEKRIENKKFVLTNEIIETLGKFLDSNDGLHIDEVYFTRDGGYYFTKHSWKDGKVLKHYSRLTLESRPYDVDGRGQQMWRNERVGHPENEIVETISAEDLVDKYLKNKNKK